MEITSIRYLDEIDDMMEEDLYDYDEEIANPENLGDDKIIIEGPLYRLRDTKLIIATGVYCNYNSETDELEPDFAVSLLYKAAGEPDLDSPLYWEQDPPATMIHNYLSIIEHAEDSKEAAILQECAVA